MANRTKPSRPRGGGGGGRPESAPAAVDPQPSTTKRRNSGLNDKQQQQYAGHHRRGSAEVCAGSAAATADSAAASSKAQSRGQLQQQQTSSPPLSGERGAKGRRPAKLDPPRSNPANDLPASSTTTAAALPPPSGGGRGKHPSTGGMASASVSALSGPSESTPLSRKAGVSPMNPTAFSWDADEGTSGGTTATTVSSSETFAARGVALKGAHHHHRHQPDNRQQQSDEATEDASLMAAAKSSTGVAGDEPSPGATSKKSEPDPNAAPFQPPEHALMHFEELGDFPTPPTDPITAPPTRPAPLPSGPLSTQSPLGLPGMGMANGGAGGNIANVAAAVASAAASAAMPPISEEEFLHTCNMVQFVAQPALVQVVRSMMEDFPFLVPQVRMRCDQAMSVFIQQQQQQQVTPPPPGSSPNFPLGNAAYQHHQHPTQQQQLQSQQQQSHAGRLDANGRGGTATHRDRGNAPSAASLGVGAPAAVGRRSSTTPATSPSATGNTSTTTPSAQGGGRRRDDEFDMCGVHGNMRPSKHLTFNAGTRQMECVPGFHCLENRKASATATTVGLPPPTPTGLSGSTGTRPSHLGTAGQGGGTSRPSPTASPGSTLTGLGGGGLLVAGGGGGGGHTPRATPPGPTGLGSFSGLPTPTKGSGAAPQQRGPPQALPSGPLLPSIPPSPSKNPGAAANTPTPTHRGHTPLHDQHNVANTPPPESPEVDGLGDEDDDNTRRLAALLSDLRS